jgi:hypothetical protein
LPRVQHPGMMIADRETKLKIDLDGYLSMNNLIVETFDHMLK